MSNRRCGEHEGRVILEVTGADRVSFLQGLVTQDMKRVQREGLAYGAMLTPQGKLIADFLLVERDESILLDVDARAAEDLARRLAMFKLRADVGIARTDLRVTRGLGDMPEGGLPDPRSDALGWRLYGSVLCEGDAPDWDELHIRALVPQFGSDLVPGESFILELGFERLNGVDFRKGCYVGQEVTARMHHKTELRRGLMQVRLGGPGAPGDSVHDPKGRVAGVLGTCAGDLAMAVLRHDRLDDLRTETGTRVEPVGQ